MRICYLVNNDDLYLNRYAVDNIGQELAALGHTIIVINERNHTELLYCNPDLIILIRIKYQEALVVHTLQPFLKKVPIIYHIDDYIFDNTYEVYHPAIDKMIEFCDYATTTTNRLEEHIIRKYGESKFLGLVPNTLSRFHQDASKSFSPWINEKRVITYLSGTSTHDNDWKECEDSVKGLLKVHSDVILCIVGSLNVSPLLLSDNPYKIIKLPLLPYIDMLRVLKFANINLAPLADNELNNCKSPLKLFESGYFGVPTICSSRATYSEYYHNDTAFIAQHKEEWFGLVNQLLTKKNTYIEYQKQAKYFSEPYLVQNKVSAIESLYKRVSNK